MVAGLFCCEKGILRLQEKQSSVSFDRTERSDSPWGIGWEIDFPEFLLVFHDILLQGSEQTFRMLRIHDDPASHCWFWDTGQQRGEVDYKFRTGMRYYRQVGIYASCQVLWYLNLELIAVVVLSVFHNL